MIAIKQYFNLQFVMLKRQLKDFGIDPTTGIIILIIVFLVISILTFSKTEYAKYLYIMAALSITLNHAETNRNDFLKSIFIRKKYFIIRSVENVLTVLPFVIFLLFKKEIYLSFSLISLSILVIFFNSKSIFQVIIPTPFFKKPYEFIVGFRKTFIVIFAVYFTLIMAIIYHNFNLGLVSLIFIFLNCLTFYSETENVFYVWIHKQTVNQFLWFKIKTGLTFSTFISLPVIICLLMVFKNNLLLIISVQLLCFVYLVTIIFLRYAAFPQKINLPHAILFGLGLMMPPLLIVLIPFFYFQSYKKLKAILAC